MKNIFGYLVIMALLLSCSKGGVEPFSPDGESGVPVAFSPSTDWQPVSGAKSSGTKALIEDADDLKNYSISLLGNAVRGGETYPVFKNHQLQWSDAEGWHYSPLKYWIPQANYTFAAFCPYATNESITGSISNGTVAISGPDTAPVITITDYNTTVERSEDLLYATGGRDNTSSENYEPVPLNFQHLLSCISFNIRNTSNTAITEIRDIHLTGLLTTCDIEIDLNSADLINMEIDSQFSGNQRPVSGESTPFLPAAMGAETYKPLFDCTNLTVLPQEVYKEEIILNFTAYFNGSEPVPYTLNLGSISAVQEWEEGKKYNYNITVSSKDIIFQVTEVPWEVHKVQLK